MTAPVDNEPRVDAAEVTIDSGVIAVVVTRGATTHSRRTIRSILNQTRLPGRVIIVDVAGHLDADQGRRPARDAAARLLTDSSLLEGLDADPRIAVEVLALSGARAWGSAITAAVQHSAATSHSAAWIWTLHDDSAPLPDALENLRLAVEHADSVAIAGPKQVRWGAPEQLIEVGYTVSRGGRRLSGVEPGEVDQGQHDPREDVLAVGLAGALIRTDVWQDLGGTDPTLGAFMDSTDLCFRARRAGHRVVVVPSAVVEHAQLSLNSATERGLADAVLAEDLPAETHSTEATDASFGHRLRSWLYFRIVSASWPTAALLVAWFVVCSVPRALHRVAVKRPSHAWDELVAPWWLIVRLPLVVAARHRSARTARLGRRVIAPLQASTRDILVSDHNRRLARAAVRKAARHGSDLDRADRSRLARRRRTGLGALILVLGTLTTLAMRSHIATIFDGHHLSGGAMLSASGSWAQWWSAVSSGWNTEGLGLSAPADALVTALLPALAVAGGDLQRAVTGLYVLSILLGGLGAWFAAGAITRSVGVRVWAGIAWVAVPVALASATSGRFGAVLVHATLPWFLLALYRALGLQRTDRRQQSVLPQGSVTALGAAALAWALVCSAAPVLLIPGFAVIAAAFVASRGRARRQMRRALWLIPLPAVTLLAPTLLRAMVTRQSEGWRLLIADPGGIMGYDSVPSWQRLLGLPAHLDWLNSSNSVSTVLPWAMGGLIAILAVVGTLRGGSRGKVARVGLVVAAVGALTAAVSNATVVTVSGGEAVRGWPGPGVSLLAVGLLVAAISAVDGVGAAAAKYPFGWRQISAGALAIACVGLPLTWSAIAFTQAHHTTSVQATDSVTVPAIARQMQDSDRQVRVLALSTDGASVSYRLLRGDGTQITDSSAVVKVARLYATSDPVAGAVAQLAAVDGTDVLATLRMYGIGAVLLPDGSGVGAALANRLDSAAGLQRVTEGNRDLVWRVSAGDDTLDQISWAAVSTATDESGEPLQILAAAHSEVHDSIDPPTSTSGTTRFITIAERAAPGWHATVGGVELAQVDRADGLLAFDLGAHHGVVEVTYIRASRMPWLALQAGVLLIFILLALPLRRQGGPR